MLGNIYQCRFYYEIVYILRTKKRHGWELKINKKFYTIELLISKLTKRYQLLINGEEYCNKKWKKKLDFRCSAQIRKVSFDIRQEEKNEFELYINDRAYSDIEM